MKIEIKIDGEDMMKANLEVDSAVIAEAAKQNIDAAKEAFMGVCTAAWNTWKDFETKLETGAESPDGTDGDAEPESEGDGGSRI